MTHPSEYYVRYLLAKGHADESATYETIALTLSSCGLPHLKENAFHEIEATFSPPDPFMFQNKRHKGTTAFMKEQKIYTMWRPKDDEKAALDLLLMSQIREGIQILLMGRIKATDIALRLGRKFDTPLKPRTVQTFAHYFWNVESVGLEHWRDLLHGNSLRDHYLAARSCSPQQALFRAGLDPVIAPKNALKEAYRSLAMRIEATRQFPDTKNTAQILTSLIKEMTAIHSLLHGEGEGVEETVKGLRKFKVERNAEKAKPIRLVAPKGNYSGSGKEN